MSDRAKDLAAMAARLKTEGGAIHLGSIDDVRRELRKDCWLSAAADLLANAPADLEVMLAFNEKLIPLVCGASCQEGESEDELIDRLWAEAVEEVGRG